jgi:ABC-2 type transport system ATP-binding protein
MLENLSQHFEITPAHYHSIHEDVKLHIKIPENSSANDLLHHLITLGQVNHFVEVVPSVNDIFIKTVGQHA